MVEQGRPELPTIDDVAALAGVSRAVASRALSTAKRPVSAEKRERVLQAAAQLGYRVNLLAQSLTTKTVNLIAVVVNHIHDLSDLDLFDLIVPCGIPQVVMTSVAAELLREGDAALMPSVREKVVGSFCDVFDASAVSTQPSHPLTTVPLW